MQPDGQHIAELNIGRQIPVTDDPRMAEFIGAAHRDCLAAEAAA